MRVEAQTMKLLSVSPLHTCVRQLLRRAAVVLTTTRWFILNVPRTIHRKSTYRENWIKRWAEGAASTIQIESKSKLVANACRKLVTKRYFIVSTLIFIYISCSFLPRNFIFIRIGYIFRRIIIYKTREKHIYIYINIHIRYYIVAINCVTKSNAYFHSKVRRVTRMRTERINNIFSRSNFL